MSPTHASSFLAALFGLALLLPGVALAAPFPVPLPVIKTISLETSLQIQGVQARSPAVVAANTDFTIVWSSSGVGCVSNWSPDVLPASGSVTGSLTANRTFVITCYGLGAAQTARFRAIVGSSDLVVPAISITGLKSSRDIAGSYFAGKYTLHAAVRNAGNLPVAATFANQYQVRSGETEAWGPLGESMNLVGLTGGGSRPLPNLEWQSPEGANLWYFRACADTGGGVISEANEDNNCSRVLGPYKFIRSQ